jgi:hypothetical protein
VSIRNAFNRVSIPLLLFAVVSGSSFADPPRTADSVDIGRYMGRWYEIAALPNFFQRQCVRDTTADYRLRSDGTVAVTNRCRKEDGTVDEAQGIARAADPATNSKLEVNRGLALALALCALGAASGLYALAHNRLGILGIYPELPPDAELITSGPYRWVRHPMYTSLMLMMFGIALYNLHIINLLGVVLVASVVLGNQD